MHAPEKPIGNYRWPWFVLAAVVLAIVVAILWTSREVQRARRIRDATHPPAVAPTNSPN